MHDCQTIQKLVEETLKGTILPITTISRARPKLFLEDAIIALAEHVKRANDGSSLFIFHYAGHGVYSDSSHGLELKAPVSTRYRADPASLPFTDITRRLDRTEVDFLFIVDCCEAGSHERSSIPNRRDFMFACQQGETTSGGDYSFTKAINSHWRRLWDSGRDSFILHEITEAIRTERSQNAPRPITKSHGREICIGPSTASKGGNTVSALVIAAFHVDVDTCRNKEIATLAARLASNAGVRVLCALPAQSAVLLIQMPLHVYSHLSQFCETHLISVSVESEMATFPSST